MFLHKTAESRKVCGHTGNAHHSTFSCQKKQTKSVSGQYVLNDFTLREKKRKKSCSENDKGKLLCFFVDFEEKNKKKKEKMEF